MKAQPFPMHLTQSLLKISSCGLACLLLTVPAHAQATPQEVDAAMGKINQTLEKPGKILENLQLQPKSPAIAAPRSGAVRVYEEPKAGGQLDQEPVTLIDEKPDNTNQETLTTLLKGSVTKSETLPIDLTAVLKLVEAQNLPISHDQLTSKIQKTAYYRSIADMLPDISGSYQQTRFEGGTQIFGSQILTFTRVQYVPQLLATWTIRPGGEDFFKALAAKRRFTGSKSLLKTTLQEQLASAAQDYYHLIETQIQVENIKIGIEEAKNQVSLNESRLKAGVGTKLDVMRATSQKVEKERDLIIAETDRAKAEQTLLNRLNLDTDVALTTESSFAQPRLLVPLSYDTPALIAMAKVTNPTLAQTQAEIKALHAESLSIIAHAVPSVTLQTYVQGTGPDLQTLAKGTFIGLNINSGLFEKLGTALPLDYRSKRLQIQQKENELKILQRQTEQQVIQAYLDSRQSAKSILTAWQGLEVAEEAYRLAVGRFRAGLGINVDVLDAQTVLSAARTTVAQTTIAFNQSQIGLLQALGQVSQDSILNGLKINVKTSTKQPPKSISPKQKKP